MDHPANALRLWLDVFPVVPVGFGLQLRQEGGHWSVSCLPRPNNCAFPFLPPAQVYPILYNYGYSPANTQM